MKIVKKLLVLVLSLSVSIMTTYGIDIKADDIKVSFADAYVLFDIWQGNGDTSVKIGDDFVGTAKELVGFEEYEKLQLDGRDIEASSYDVTKVDDKMVITLKEDYVEQLSDGRYAYNVIYKRAVVKAYLYVVRRKNVYMDAYIDLTLEKDGTARVNFEPNVFKEKFYYDLFDNLLYKGKVVDSNYYVKTRVGNGIRITLKDTYVKNLPDGTYYFTADFKNVRINLKLEKGLCKPTAKSPDRVSKIKITSKKKSFYIKWKKQKAVSGYELKIGTNKKITKNKKTVRIQNNKNSKTIKKLKKHKKYYVKIRAYKIVEGNKIFGKWSKIVEKKTK